MLCHKRVYVHWVIGKIGFVLHKKADSFQTLTATADYTDFTDFY